MSGRTDIRQILSSSSGQSVVEYVIMLAIVMMLFIAMRAALKDMRYGDLLSRPIKKDFAAAYQYGHPQAKDPSEGAEWLPHAPMPNAKSNNFRMFIQLNRNGP